MTICIRDWAGIDPSFRDISLSLCLVCAILFARRIYFYLFFLCCCLFLGCCCDLSLLEPIAKLHSPPCQSIVQPELHRYILYIDREREKEREGPVTDANHPSTAEPGATLSIGRPILLRLRHYLICRPRKCGHREQQQRQQGRRNARGHKRANQVEKIGPTRRIFSWPTFGQSLESQKKEKGKKWRKKGR